MIPSLDQNGRLPPGKHQATLAEVEEIFVYNAKRREIFEGLKKLIELLKSVNSGTIYLDGSFVTAKARPSDIDVCWQPLLQATKENRKYHKDVFKADIFPADIVEQNSKKYFLDFFQFDKDSGEKKGIIKIDLT
jgi:hypothetical protein